MGKASAPPPPNLAAAAQETATGNLENSRIATTANRVNTYTPYGNLTYSQDPSNQDKWSSNISLDPSQQHLLDASNQSSLQLAGMQGSAANRVGGAMNSPLPVAYNPTQATNNAADLMNARLLPQQQRDQAAMNTQLANQGITQGSQAYQNAQDQLGRNQNDARQQSQLAGINMGQNQQAQQYAQGISNRNMPMNDYNALRTGSQVTNPTFSNAPQQQTVAGPDMLGAANSSYKAAMQGVNAQNANSGNMMNGLMGMGATYAGSAAGSAAIAAMF